MSNREVVALLPLILTLGCAQPTPEQRFVNDAAAALGGRERLMAVRTLVLEGSGTQFNLGQDMRPGASGQTFGVTDLVRRIDVAAGRSRTELTRTPNFVYFQGQAAQRQIQGVDGEVGYNVAASGAATRVGAAAAQDRRADFYHHPLTLVRAALAPTARIANVRTEAGQRSADVTTEQGLSFAVALDGAGLPSRIASKSYHPNLGDVIVSTAFADYADVSGLKLPARATTRIDDFTTSDLRWTTQRVDGDVGDLAAPAAAASAAPPAGPPPPNVVADVVAKGVWLLGGQSHHSLLIELSDRLLLVDAPQTEARTLAVIAKARELVPGKRLAQVITTHHHFDHTAGIRAAVAEGLSILTQEGNRAFFEEMARRPHTVVADALAKNARAATVEAFGDELIVKDAMRTVALYHIAGNPHSDTMLMVHLPADRVLVQVDAFSPGAQVNPYAANLLENIQRRKLSVDRIVPLHGTIATLKDLEAVAAKGT
jgi:glyoxylase-like metal-dependent hydrolase (beta-lactamase superfamily II)